MADECIHGFEAGLCDICYPRTPVEPPRRTGTARTPGARTLRATASAPAAPPFAFATHRFLHVTHLDNLAAILADGALVPGAVPAIDVSSSVTRDLRAGADLASGRTVAEHVAFFASPAATRWVELRDGAAGPHWSDVGRSVRPTEFVLLGVPGAALADDVVAADADAAAPATRFAVGAGDAAALLRRARVGDPELADVELLSPNPVPVSSAAIITVANDRARDTVRGLLADAGESVRVAVFPGWFQPA